MAPFGRVFKGRVMKVFRVRDALLCAALIVVAGCGGGSSGSSADATASSAGAPKQAAALEPAQAATVSNEPVLIESKVSTGSDQDIDPFKSRPASNAIAPRQIELPALIAKSALDTARKDGSSGFGVPVKIGEARDIPDSASESATAGLLAWSVSATGGKIASLRFRSTGAFGVRVGLLARSLPFGSFVRFYADHADRLFEVPGQQVMATLQRNLDAGDTSDAARTYWSPNLGGEAITVEIEIPAGAATSEVRVSIPRLSHVFLNVHKLDSIEKIGQSASCNLDVPCKATYNEISKSVAVADFVDNGTGYVCSGTLLNDRMSSGIPYFLSANHCISSQTVASTLWTRWFYKSTACNSGVENPAAIWVQTGATLLYASADTDTSFMRLNSMPPAGVVYAASNPFPVSASTAVFGIHHPRGDVQKYSEGLALGTASCSTTGLCSSPGSSSAKFWRVSWSAGTSEAGSSGSGLFTKINGTDYLTGQLYGGVASCTNPSGSEYYGRFDVAYNVALYQWLNAGPATQRAPIYRFYNTLTGAHFYTSNAGERDLVISTLPRFAYEGVGFYAYSQTPAGSSPVHRFYNSRTGAHFYTINDSERQSVQDQFSWYSYEGPSWYAYKTPATDATPMHRFYNVRTQAHFYTMSAGERDYVLQNHPQYSYEGVGYYAWTMP